jgi:hypothetical protein
VVFPDAYRAYGRSLAMVVWRDELEFNVGRAHELFESGRAFIVQLLELGFQAAIREVLVQFGICA